MLTLNGFNRLPSDQQLAYVWDHCLHLASRPIGARDWIQLYQVDDFFVEMRFYDPDHCHFLRAFANPLDLLPYVDQIDLDEFFN
ncbi:hypothetical protein [Spirosoma pulveris]